MKYKAFFAALLAAVLLISLAACTGTATVEVTPSAQTEAPAAPADPQPAPAAQQPQEPQKDETAWTLDPAGLTDAYIVETIIRLPELALSGEAFTFDAPKDLTSRQLYLLFAALRSWPPAMTRPRTSTSLTRTRSAGRSTGIWRGIR